MLWWKAIHIIAVISWMAGLLYLFRLFVYHNEESETIVKERFEKMERRLFNIIATPAGVLTLVSGVALIVYTPSFLKQGWLHTKLLLVIALIGVHFLALKVQKKLRVTSNPYGKISLRLLNELPTLLMIVIVILVVVKPF